MALQEYGFETIHEVVEPHTFDDTHPSSPFYHQPMPHWMERLSDEALTETSKDMGYKAGIDGVNRRKNPFSQRDNEDAYNAWDNGWQEGNKDY
jgi:ribosome modulation factor